MGDDFTIVGEVKKSPIGSPPLKKLKQSRLPFAPVNSKSPNQIEQSSNEKKRKHSGSDGPSSTPKTPRNESKETESSCTNENLPASKDRKSTDDKSSDETKIKDSVGKKRGRPLGSKNKSKGESCISPQSSSSPVLKKRGRISEPGPVKSLDCSISEKTESEEETASKSRELKTKSHSELGVSDEIDDSTSVSACGTESETEDGKIKTTSYTPGEGDRKESQSSNEAKSTEKRSRGRPRKSLTPQRPKDAGPKKLGRPFGSKNKKTSQSSLNSSRCSDEGSSSAGSTPLSEKKVLPKEKTRKFLAVFASPKLISSQEETNDKDNSLSSSPKTPVAKDVEKVLCKKRELKTDDDDSEDDAVDDGKKMKINEEDSEKAGDQVKEEKDEVKEITSVKHHEDENDSKKCDSKEITIAEQSQNVAQMDSQKTCKDNESSEKNDDSENHDESVNTELNESTSVVEESLCESEDSANKTDSLNSSSDVGKSPSVEINKTPTSTGPKSILFKKPKKLTPKQKEKEAAKLLKKEERAKLKQEKEKQLQEKQLEKEKLRKQREEEKRQKDEEKQKQKEEKEKAKEELRKKRQEELDAKRQKKEEEQQKKEEEKLKKDEERMKKEEEKQKKIEEQQKIEEEKRKQSEKRKTLFASFFVAKKREAEDEGKDAEGPFKEFRVKEDMQLAPLVRNRLSETQLAELDEYISGEGKSSFESYLKLLKSESYIKGKYERTWPSKKENEEDDDDIMIVDEEEDDVGNCSDMIQDPVSGILQDKKHKAKLLQFCENQRPAYWGTWSKKSSLISARHPFAKDEIFDYEYDSDDDWEEEEAGESLSDSEGEDKEEKEEGDQYEVDNDFFVPHGYLSDDEGKFDVDDDGEESNASKSKDAEKNRNTEQLKQKQAEFEEEMKQKTKALKPRVIGCLWMADANNNAAYDQLLKILKPHKAVTLCSQIPIGSRHSQRIAKECPENDEEEFPAECKAGNSKKYVKAFPEEAIPALIKLLHGNRLGKPKLCYEFTQYWGKLTGGELEESKINQTPTSIQAAERVYISKRRLGAKIQELGTWKRCQDKSQSRHIMCWYVPEKIRKEFGLGDLTLANSWIYATNINDKKDDVDSEEDTPKRNKIRPITAFTKKIPSTPSSTNTSPSSTPSSTPLHNQSKSESSPLLGDGVNMTPVANTSTSSIHSTPVSTPDVTPARKLPPSGSKSKKKVNLFPGKVKETSGPQKGSIVSFFKKSKENSPQCSKSDSNCKGKSEKKSAGASEEVITLD